jgi:glycosyltransferase involved in cell wall biosynthesis
MDQVVCVSEGQARKVRRCGVPATKVQVIRDAVRVERFERVSREYRGYLESLFPQKPEVIVGAAGRLSPEKGFGVLVDAAVEVLRQRPGVGFVLVGDGPLRAEIQSRVEAIGLSDVFRLTGFRNDLDDMFPHFDVFVLPSFTEGLPNVVLEAFAARVPVVATAVGGTPEVVDEGTNGYLVPPGEPGPLADRIARLLADPADREAMGARGRERVEREFSFAGQAAAYRKLFDRLLFPRQRSVAGGLARVR